MSENEFSGVKLGGGNQNTIQTNCRKSGDNGDTKPRPNKHARHYKILLLLGPTIAV